MAPSVDFETGELWNLRFSGLRWSEVAITFATLRAFWNCRTCVPFLPFVVDLVIFLFAFSWQLVLFQLNLFENIPQNYLLHISSKELLSSRKKARE